MKKLIALLAALTMLFVCGCSSNSKDNGTDNGNGTNNGTNNAVDERRRHQHQYRSVMTSAKAWTMQARPSETRWTMAGNAIREARRP